MNEQMNINNYSLPEVQIRLKEGPRVYTTEPISSPPVAVKLLSNLMKDLDREYCFVINLNTQLQPINFSCVSIGGLDRALVPVSNIFKAAILSNAASVIMLHNHPSGNSEPSKEDLAITNQIREAGKLISIPLLDHVIVSSTGHFRSLREEGYIFDDTRPDAVFDKRNDYAVEQKNKLKDLTDQLEKGVKAVFESESYQKYLSCMSKFHRYSISNSILIHMQRPDASYVAGYMDWQKKFHRQVNKGEKGIAIIAPAPYKRKVEETVKDNTGQPVLNSDGSVQKTVREVPVDGYKVTYCFDISQTSGEELPTYRVDELKGTVKDFEHLDRAIRDISPVPIFTEDITSGAKGYFSDSEKKIVIKAGMDEAQTLKTEIHELAHSLLHSSEGTGKDSDRRTKEVQADSVAFVVCNHYGLDSSSYSFPYIAGWSSDKTVPELKASLETIRKTSDDVITKIDQKLVSYQIEKTSSLIQHVDKSEVPCLTM